MAFDGRTGPHQLAGLGVAGIDLADDAELAAGHAGDDHAVHDQGSCGGGVTGLVVLHLFLPDHLAGVLVQGDDFGVQGFEDHQVVVQGGAAVNHVAAGQDAVGQTVLVLPQLLAGLDVQGIDAGIGTGHEHLAVMHNRLGFLAALLFATEGEGPHGHQIADILGVDILQRAVTLAGLTEAGGDDVVGRRGVVQDVCIGHDSVGGAYCEGEGTGRNQHLGQRKLLDFHIFLLAI